VVAAVAHEVVRVVCGGEWTFPYVGGHGTRMFAAVRLNGRDANV
jgi:hypothetical protein